MNNFTIPSKFIRIIGGQFQGYDAFFREKFQGGKFIKVIVGATGYETVIPIYNAIFLMNDGKQMKYIINDEGNIKLIDTKQDIDYIITEEDEKSPTIFDNIFIPDNENVELPEISDENDDTEFNELEFEDPDNEKLKTIDYNLQQKFQLGDITKLRSLASKSTSKLDKSFVQDYIHDFIHTHQEIRNNIPIDTHPITDLMSQLCALLELNFDIVTTNKHSLRLQQALNTDILVQINYTIGLYKLVVMAYIFIYINELGIGIPVNIAIFNKNYSNNKHINCKYSSNDDPTQLWCMCIKSDFITKYDFINTDETETTLSLENLINFIKLLLVPLNTSIIPVKNKESKRKLSEDITVNNINKRFAILDINSNKPTYSKNYTVKEIIFSEPAKENILQKVNKKISEIIRNNITLLTSKELVNLRLKQNNNNKNFTSNEKLYIKNEFYQNIYKDFHDNFDKYLKPDIFNYIKNNPHSIEYKLLMDFLLEYKRNNPNLRKVILPLNISRKTLSIPIKQKIINDIGKRIDLEKNTTKKSILENFINNFDLYIKGDKHKNLLNITDNNKIILPYIKEYFLKLNLAERNFEKNQHTTIIKNSIPTNISIEDIKNNIINEIKLDISHKIKKIGIYQYDDEKLSDIQINSLYNAYNNINNIVNLNRTIIAKSLKQANTYEDRMNILAAQDVFYSFEIKLENSLNKQQLNSTYIKDTSIDIVNINNKFKEILINIKSSIPSTEDNYNEIQKTFTYVLNNFNKVLEKNFIDDVKIKFKVTDNNTEKIKLKTIIEIYYQYTDFLKKEKHKNLESKKLDSLKKKEQEIVGIEEIINRISKHNLLK